MWLPSVSCPLVPNDDLRLPPSSGMWLPSVSNISPKRPDHAWTDLLIRGRTTNQPIVLKLRDAPV